MFSHRPTNSNDSSNFYYPGCQGKFVLELINCTCGPNIVSCSLFLFISQIKILNEVSQRCRRYFTLADRARNEGLSGSCNILKLLVKQGRRAALGNIYIFIRVRTIVSVEYSFQEMRNYTFFMKITVEGLFVSSEILLRVKSSTPLDYFIKIYGWFWYIKKK